MDASRVYWLQRDSGELVQLEKGTGHVNSLALAPAARRLLVVGDAAFWTTLRGGVRTVPTIGGSVEVVAADICDTTECGKGIAADQDAIYWIGEDRIHARPHKGGATTDIATPAILDADILVDESSLYWMSVTLDGTFRYSIHKSPKTGGDHVTLAQFDQYVGAMAVDAEHIYVGRLDGIWRIAKADGVHEHIVDSGPPRHLAVDGFHIYATELKTMWRVPPTGGTLELLACDQVSAHRIALDEVRAYWVDQGTDQILAVEK